MCAMPEAACTAYVVEYTTYAGPVSTYFSRSASCGMKETSHASFEAAAVISPELEYSTIFTGTPSLAAAATPRSTVTPRARPLAGSRVAQKADGDGPTATATRSAPCGAISEVETVGAAAHAARSSAPAAARGFICVLATRRALAVRVVLHRLARERQVGGNLHRLEERLGLAARAHLAVHRAHLVGVRRDHRGGLHQVVDHVGGLGRADGEAVADVDHRELRVIVVAHDALHVRRDARVPREVGHEPVAEPQDVSGGEAHVARDACRLHGRAELSADVVGVHAVAVHGRDRRDLHAAHGDRAAEAREDRIGGVAAQGLQLRREEGRHLASGHDLRLLAVRDLGRVG